MSQMHKNFVIESDFSMNAVLTRSFEVLFSRPLLFFGMAAITVVPTTVMQYVWTLAGRDLVYFTGRAVSSAAKMYLAAGFFMFFITMVLGLFTLGAIIHSVLVFLSGDEPTCGEGLSVSARRMPHLVLQNLCISASVFLAAFIFTLVPMFFLEKPGLYLGILLTSVFALVACSAWMVGPPVCVLEQLGPIASLSRSAELTKGYRLKIFGLFFILGIVVTAIIFVLDTLSGFIFSSSQTLSVQVPKLLFALISLFTNAFISILLAVIYRDLLAANGEPLPDGAFD